MGKIDIFRFEEQEVRTHIDENGEPWFVAKDVCVILGIGNTSQAVSRLDTEDKNTIILNEGIPGNPNTSIINESGLYELVIRSDKHEAKKFRKWITSEVLPSIRKTGNYSVKTLTPAQMLLQQAQMLVEQERKIAEIERTQEEQGILLADMRDGADFYAITAYHKVFLKKPISNEDAKKDGFRLAKICKAHGIRLGRSPHPLWGTVNTYSKAILDEYYVRGGNLSEN